MNNENNNRNIKRILEATLMLVRKLKYFEYDTVNSENLELVSNIREELTKLAGPEDIMSVKIIKKNVLDQARENMLKYIRYEYSKSICMELIYEKFSLPSDVILDLWNECMKQSESIQKGKMAEERAIDHVFSGDPDMCKYMKEQLNKQYGVATIPGAVNVDNFLKIMDDRFKDTSFNFENRPLEERFVMDDVDYDLQPLQFIKRNLTKIMCNDMDNRIKNCFDKGADVDGDCYSKETDFRFGMSEDMKQKHV